MASGNYRINTNARWVYFTVNWSSSKDTARNRSRVSVKVTIHKSGGSPWNAYGPRLTIGINGNKGSKSCSFDLRNRTSQNLWTRTVTVGHNSNGTKSCPIYINFPTGIDAGTVNNTKYVTLDTIPRASTMSLSTTSVNYGGSIKFTIHKASSSFQHIINGNWGAWGNIMSKSSATSFTWTVPLKGMYNIPNSTSYKATIWLDTYSGSTKVGVKEYKVRLNVPSSVVPTLGSISFWDRNSTTAGLMGGDQMVQGASNVEHTINGANGTYGSSLNQYQIVDVNNRTVTQGGNQLYAVPQSSGTRTIKGRVRDTRGRWSVWKTRDVPVYAYSAPRLNSLSVRRTDSGTTVQVKSNGSISALNGKNSYDFWVDVSDKGKNSWTNKYHYNSGTSFDLTGTLSGSYDIAKSYDIRVNFTDKLQNTSSRTSFGTIKKAFTIRENIGVGVGKLHERGALDVGGDLYMNGNVIRGGSLDNRGTPPTGDALSLEYWKQFPQGFSIWMQKAGGTTNMPSNWGLLQVTKTGAIGDIGDFSVLYHAQSQGAIYRLSGNFNSIGTWRELAYTTGDKSPWAVPDGWFKNGFTHYGGSNSNQKLYISKSGKIVQLFGAVKNTNLIHGSPDPTVILGIGPGGYKPNAPKFPSVGQGSGMSRFFCEVNYNGDGGELCIARYGTTSVSDIPSGSWLNINITYTTDE